MAKALFLIPCCSRKIPGGDQPDWDQVKGENGVQVLDKYREELMGFYTSLSQEDAPLYYKGRGSGEQRHAKVLKAWKKNKMTHQSKTMKAIYRYNGNMYSAIGRDIINKLANGEVDNVLIVSALMGIIKLAPVAFISLMRLYSSPLPLMIY
jgi:cytoplasmic iron level regulating protein YaaA (DUF328/UPF0246 family)